VRAAFVKPGGGVELREVPVPTLERGSVLVEMKASGVCGTDLEKLTGKNITSSTLGHEVSGTIRQSDDDRFPVGTRVVPHHHVSCGKCDYCKVGAGTMCEGFRTSNFVPCGFADQFLVPSYNVVNGGLHKFGLGLSFQEASMAEPLACCLRGIRHVIGSERSNERVARLNKVLIVGAGPIGLLHMELIRRLVPESMIVAVDIIPKRLEFAEKFENALVINSASVEGGTFSAKALSLTNGAGFDLVIVATGATSAFGEALKCSRKSGTLLLFGAPHKGAIHALDLAHFFLDELTITSSYSATDPELSIALRMMEEGKFNAKKFITGEFPLDRISDAMESARSASQVKVIVVN
jgi:L-iditol 2-dehydrogenase